MHAQITGRSPAPPRRGAVTAPGSPSRRAAVRPLDLEVVVPVYNEERTLALSIRRLHRYLSEAVPLSWRIVIADNASTDATPVIAASLAVGLADVEVLRLEQRGRGRALRAAWGRSPARVVAYMDVDLSTDLRALMPLVAPLLSGHSEVAIGTRLAPGSRITRGAQREVISRAYNRLLRASLHARFSDAQCGFKAVRGDVLAELLAAVRDEGWFFDTELLIAAQRRGMRIHEVAVDWVDDPDSRVDILDTALADLRGVARLMGEARPTRFFARRRCGLDARLPAALRRPGRAARLAPGERPGARAGGRRQHGGEPAPDRPPSIRSLSTEGRST